VKNNLRQVVVGVIVWCAIALCFANAAMANGRKRRIEVKPRYPEIARAMNLSGAVNLELTVEPDGIVKNVKVLGGHPVLVQASVDAVKQWKYEPSPSETTESIQFKFNPNQNE
jgi:TonB family protein